MHHAALWTRRPRQATPWRQLLATLTLATIGLTPLAQAAQQPAPDRAAVQQALSGLAVPFEHNVGQFDPRVAYMAKTFAGAVFVTRDGRLTYSLPGKVLDDPSSDDRPLAKAQRQRQRPTERGPGWALSETLIGAQPLTPQGTRQAITHVTRFTPEGTHQASTWQGVRLGQAWPGIEVEVAARGANIEKLFHLAPGADPARIGIALQGAQSLRIGEQGQLIAATGNGDIAYTAPVAWQDIDGKRVPVGVRYALRGGDKQTRHYGFALEGWDRKHPLTIDPLIQSTYVGGSGRDYINALAIAANGDVVVGGFTYSNNLPGTSGSAQPSLDGVYDGFVTRLSGDLKTLVQSTYVGGSGDESIQALAIAANGDVVAGGFTYSNNLPGTSGGAQPGYSGGVDGFVTRLSGDLKTLVQSTYLGGSDYDAINALAIAANGDVVVGGYTTSTNLPGRLGGAQPRSGGVSEGFVTRLSGDLKTLVQSTYVGGSDYDAINALAIAANGDVVVGGFTTSTNLPGRSGGTQDTIGGYADGFVARLSGDLKTLVQSTYVGGSSGEEIRALAIAANGDVVVGEITWSDNLPGRLGGAQPSHGGGGDGFVTRLSGDLKTLVQSTYLGGSSDEEIRALAIAANGDVVVGGITKSTNLPGRSGGAQPGFRGGYDGFVTRLSGDLKTLVQSTYVGGSGDDHVYAFAIAANGDVVVGGYTNSTNLPGTSGGAQPASRGSQHGFVTRLSGDLKAPRLLDIDGSTPGTTYDAATDGVLLVRYLLGYRGAALVADALGGTAQRDAAQIDAHIASNLASFDVDGDGETLALTDGLMILRRMLGLTGAAVTAGATLSTRSDDDVIQAIDALMP